MGSITVALRVIHFLISPSPKKENKKKIKSTKVRLRLPKKAGELSASYFFIFVQRKSDAVTEACMNVTKAN